MTMDPEHFLASAAQARRIAGALDDASDARKLLTYAEECEIAAVLERMGQLSFEDIPVPPRFRPPPQPQTAPQLALVR